MKTNFNEENSFNLDKAALKIAVEYLFTEYIKEDEQCSVDFKEGFITGVIETIYKISKELGTPINKEEVYECFLKTEEDND